MNDHNYVMSAGMLVDLFQISQNLKNYRVKLGYTQEQFALLAGYDSNYDARYIRKLERMEIATDIPIRNFCEKANINYSLICKGCTWRIRQSRNGMPVLIPHTEM